MLQQSYRLVIIEPERIPLSAGTGATDSFLVLTLAVMLATVVCICLWAYLARCRDYRERIRKLDPGGEEVYMGWNIWRLRQTVEELELDRAWVF